MYTQERQLNEISGSNPNPNLPYGEKNLKKSHSYKKCLTPILVWTKEQNKTQKQYEQTMPVSQLFGDHQQ
jgi:hypothetical protein